MCLFKINKKSSFYEKISVCSQVKLVLFLFSRHIRYAKIPISCLLIKLFKWKKMCKSFECGKFFYNFILMKIEENAVVMSLFEMIMM